ncbi:MAG: radical SAM family heme chaperone HemW [Prevotellaceae bacterium]|nr:radical SAM family heme chaperone HemW [Prevotellaceae bacterium]
MKYHTVKQGVYIHIPFCKSRCVYCDFYSTTQSEQSKDLFIEALANEVKARAHFFGNNTIDTLYLGGGTPSTLGAESLSDIFNIIKENFVLKPEAEVTIEVNPDDVAPTFADHLTKTGVNRVSMGVQTFNDNHLSFLHRRHSANQAISAIKTLRNAGITNISIDLIYGLPGQTLEQWQKDLDTAFSQNISHLSAYALIFEEGTALYNMREKGLVAEADEELSLEMFTALMNKAREAGFLHYEISNFSLPDLHSRHNSGYWDGMHYLGLGPGAHSYNGTTRFANIGNLSAYLKVGGLTTENNLSITEHLTISQQIEETLLTSLRTAGGLDLTNFNNRFGTAALRRIINRALPYIYSGKLILSDHRFNTFPDKPTFIPNIDSNTLLDSFKTMVLSREGIFVSDDIISSLFD